MTKTSNAGSHISRVADEGGRVVQTDHKKADDTLSSELEQDLVNLRRQWLNAMGQTADAVQRTEEAQRTILGVTSQAARDHVLALLGTSSASLRYCRADLDLLQRLVDKALATVELAVAVNDSLHVTDRVGNEPA